MINLDQKNLRVFIHGRFACSIRRSTPHIATSKAVPALLSFSPQIDPRGREVLIVNAPPAFVRVWSTIKNLVVPPGDAALEKSHRVMCHVRASELVSLLLCARACQDRGGSFGEFLEEGSSA